MGKFFESYIGKKVTDPRYTVFKVHTEEIDYRPYDENAKGEEAEWNLSVRLVIRMEDEYITDITPEYSVFCFGDSGLGDIDPSEHDYWSPEDDAKAEEFLKRITK